MLEVSCEFKGADFFTSRDPNRHAKPRTASWEQMIGLDEMSSVGNYLEKIRQEDERVLGLERMEIIAGR